MREGERFDKDLPRWKKTSRRRLQRLRGSSCSPSASPSSSSEAAAGDAQPRKEGDVPVQAERLARRSLNPLLGQGDEVGPSRRSPAACPGPGKRECPGHDRQHVHFQHHDVDARPHRPRQHVAQGDPPALTAQTGAAAETKSSSRSRRTSDLQDAGQPLPTTPDQGDDDVLQPRPQRGHQHQHQIRPGKAKVMSAVAASRRCRA